MKKEEKELGCCGYDELAEKPATTSPIVFGIRTERPRKPEFDPLGRSMSRPMKLPTSMGSAAPRIPVVNL
jgi:hypothetical protein